MSEPFREWGKKCREGVDFLGDTFDDADGPARSLGKECPVCDEDRWFVVPTPDDPEWTEEHYCQCCGHLVIVWRR